MDKFPEAFRRFEKVVVVVRRIRSFRQLFVAFRWWSGEKYRGTPRQIEALKIEALKRGIPVPTKRPYVFRELKIVKLEPQTWRHETVRVRGTVQSRYRDIKTGRFVEKPRMREVI